MSDPGPSNLGDPFERREVLIVGAGPVGLALAIELGLRGIRCTVVEERDGTVKLPKMNSVSTRTMEFCRRWGVVDRIWEKSYPADHPYDVRFVTAMLGRELLRYPFPSYRDRKFDYTPEGYCMCSQQFFDPILAERARSLPSVRILYNTKLKSYVERDNGVRASVIDLGVGRARTIDASFLVGCDGAGSTVRHLAGITSDGLPDLNHNMNIYFRSVALQDALAGKQAQMHRLVDKKGPWGNLLSIDGRALWRLTVHLKQPADPKTFDAAGYLRRAVGGDIPLEIITTFAWARRQVIAEQYRKGAVFLAGDAAHQLSTTGGFGMNTGVGDAVDLGWKLAAAVQGWAGASLLDTYRTERWPIGWRNIEEAMSNFQRQAALPSGDAIDDESAAGDALRASFAEAAEAGQVRRQFATEGVALGYRYDESPIVVPDGTSPPPDETMAYTQTARPGSRAPHAWLSDRRSTLDLFGDGFCLLDFAGKSSASNIVVDAACAVRLPVKIASIRNQSVRDLYGSDLVLVRPDGHVAWRGDHMQDGKALIDTVRGARGGGP